MSEIIGYCVMVCGGVIISLLTIVGAFYTVFWAASRVWDSIMWTDPNSGYKWECVPYDGYKRRLWFTGIRVGRFGIGVMGSKTVRDQPAKEANER